MSLFTELKRRNVFRVATAYVVVGWLFTEIATTLLGTFGAPEWVAKAVILFLVLGFFPVVIFSWAFELTPEGIKREKDVDRSQSITSETGQKLNYVTIVAVIAGIAFLAFTRMGSDAPRRDVREVTATDAPPSVAVLPFVNMSGNAENEYFSDGLTETLLHMLAQIPELRVAARTSSFAFKGQDSDIREIAAALDVAHILEGSVQRAGSRLRITAQLIRADDGFHVWSENYDRTLDDIFAIQDEIASDVGEALSASLLGTTRPAPIVGVGTENLVAYDRFLQALAEHQKGSYGSLQKAEGLLKDALGLDPDFHDAKIELARVYKDQYQTGLLNDGSALADIVSLLEQVLASRPDDVGATSLLYYTEVMQLVYAGEPAPAMQTIDLLARHVDAHPGDVESAQLLGTLYARFNRGEEAVVRLRAALDYDPLNPGIHYELGQAYFELERWEDARKALERSLEIEPLQPNAETVLADVYRETGDAVGFVRHYLRAMSIDPEDHELPGQIAEYLYDFRLLEEADGYRNRVLAIAPSSPAAYLANIMRAYAIGDADAARAQARKAVSDDIDERHGTFMRSVDYLVEDAIANGTHAETLEFLGATIPGLGDMSANVDIKYKVANFSVWEIWYELEPVDDAFARLEEMVSFGRQFGWDPDEDPFIRLMRRLEAGDMDAAIGLIVEEMQATSPAAQPRFDEVLQHAAIRDLADDPRLVAVAADFAQRRETIRGELRTFLAKRGS